MNIKVAPQNYSHHSSNESTNSNPTTQTTTTQSKDTMGASRNSTNTNNNINDFSFEYQNCLFQIQVQKPGFFKKTKLYMYVKPGQIIICHKPFEKKPYKIIDLNMNWKVKFIFDEKKHIKKLPFAQKVIGFKLIDTFAKDQNKLHIEYLGEGYAMVQLKQYFSKQLFLTNFYDDFSILEKLGQGKYAKVYRIQAKDSGDYYAVKYLYKQKLIAQDVGEDALLNELKILYQMDHPNIVKHVATYEDEQGYYIVTELLDEEHCLHKEIRKFRETKFDYEVVKMIMQQLLKGIDYMHQRGIMHRDLKPQNIMFGRMKGYSEGSSTANYRALKIIDFGLAQVYNDPHFIFVHVGTPGYVAPEILSNESENHRYGPQCDIFSLGVIFHLLLTGKQVFEGTKFKEVLDLNKKCRIKFEGQVYEKLNYQALNLINRMLDPNPNSRITAKQALKHEFFTQKTDRRRASQVLIDDMQYNDLSDSEVVQIDSQESIQASNLNVPGVGQKKSSQVKGIKKQQFNNLRLNKYESNMQKNVPVAHKTEILYNKYKANSFSNLKQKEFQYARNIDPKELLKPLEIETISSPYKLQTHRISLMEPYQYQDVFIGENEVDILPSPSKQNLGKNREEIINMTHQLLKYMANVKEEKTKQYDIYEQEEEEEDMILTQQASQQDPQNAKFQFSLRKLEHKKSSSNEQDDKNPKSLQKQTSLENFGLPDNNKKQSSDNDNHLSPQEHRELRKSTEAYQQLDENTDEFSQNNNNIERSKAKKLSNLQIGQSPYNLQTKENKLENKRISAIKQNNNSEKEQHSSTLRKKRRSSLIGQQQMFNFNNQNIDENNNNNQNTYLQNQYDIESPSKQELEQEKQVQREEAINHNPFDQNILDHKVVKLLNFFPQNMFVLENFQDKMDILGKFILFGKQWIDYMGSNQKNPKNLIAIKKKIKFLERENVYNKWVFDFLKNIFFLRKWQSQKNAGAVPVLKVNLENCLNYFDKHNGSQQPSKDRKSQQFKIVKGTNEIKFNFK